MLLRNGKFYYTQEAFRLEGCDCLIDPMRKPKYLFVQDCYPVCPVSVPELYYCSARCLAIETKIPENGISSLDDFEVKTLVNTDGSTSRYWKQEWGSE